MKNDYHLEKVLLYPPYKDKYCRNLTFRFGRNSDALNVSNELIYTHPGPVASGTILVIDVTSNTVGRYLSIISESDLRLGIAAVQVITRENF